MKPCWIRRCAGSKVTQSGKALQGSSSSTLFALRSTDPSRLRSSPDPVGPDNLTTVLRHVRENETVVAAWGAHPMVGRSWVRACVLDEMRQTGRSLLCLGKTAGGRPRHPLYVKGDAPLVAYP
jgi:hypothetical protein